MLTKWELRTYDVWGNARNGYEVNDSFRQSEPVEINVEPVMYNQGTPQEFVGAYPSDKQLRSVFGVKCQIETDGDDTHIYVSRARDGYPIGELSCISHESLSPIRETAATE